MFQSEVTPVAVLLVAEGDENALGFSVSFDPALVTFISAEPGTAATGATINVNSAQASAGRVGLALALPTGSIFASGTQEVLRLAFRPTSPVSSASAVAFADQPIPRQVSNPNATALSTTYLDGVITLNPMPSLRIARSASEIRLSWPSWAASFVLREAATIAAPASGWTDVPITPALHDNEAVITLTPSGDARYYRLERR